MACDSKNDIKIGVAVSLSSSNSPMGLAVKDAVVLSVEQINQKGGIKGRKVQLLIKDDENDPKRAGEIDVELIEEGVVAIVGHTTSLLTHSALDIMNKRDMLLLSPTTSSRRVIEIDDNMISLYPPNTLEQDKLIHYIIDETDIRNISIIYDSDNSVFCDSWLSYFSALFSNRGGAILNETPFSSNNKGEIYEVVADSMVEGTEGILMIASAVDVPLISQQIMKINRDLAKFSTGWAFDDNLIYNGGYAVEDLVLPLSWDYGSDSQLYNVFKRHYYERYGKYPNYTEGFAYETMMILFESIKSVERITPMTIREQILKKADFDGLQGNIKIDGYGGTFRDVQVFKIKEGEFVRVDH